MTAYSSWKNDLALHRPIFSPEETNRFKKQFWCILIEIGQVRAFWLIYPEKKVGDANINAALWTFKQ